MHHESDTMKRRLITLNNDHLFRALSKQAFHRNGVVARTRLVALAPPANARLLARSANKPNARTTNVDRIATVPPAQLAQTISKKISQISFTNTNRKHD